MVYLIRTYLHIYINIVCNLKHICIVLNYQFALNKPINAYI